MSMKLSFRTLKGDKFKLDALPTDTVTDLKKKVVARYEDADCDAYRLIYKGKILDNANTLADSGVSESGFIVVMPPKRAPPPKTTPAPAAATSAPKSTPATAATATPAASTTPAATATPAAAAATAAGTTPVAGTPGGSTSSLVTGAEYEATVKRITEMGFPEDEVKRALRAAFNNPDRAVDYLFNGIPASAAPPAPPSTPPQTGAAATGTGSGTAPAGARPGQPFDMFGGGGGAGGGGGTGQLDFLRHHQPFNGMRRLIQANPSVLQSLLQQLEQSDPALLQLINNNREEFMNLINEPAGGEGEGPGVNDEAMEQLARALAAGGGVQGGGGGGAPPGQILVTEEENQVIQRLTEIGTSMGIEQMHVVQAWLACDKDENLAASYLLDHSEELRAQQAEDAAAMEAQRNNPGGGNPPAGGGAN